MRLGETDGISVPKASFTGMFYNELAAMKIWLDLPHFELRRIN
jgi:hypothetical protein